MQYQFENLKVWQAGMDLGRFHKKEYVQFLFTARGSAYEVMTLVRLAQNLEYLTMARGKELLEMSAEIMAMLNGLIQALQ